MTAKAKTGAESPPARSSSALAPEERIRAIISKKGRELGLSSIEIRHLQNGDLLAEWHIKEFIAAALDAQATDKAAAVEKVKALELKECFGFSSHEDSMEATNQLEAFRTAVLAILTDSEPKEEEAQTA